MTDELHTPFRRPDDQPREEPTESPPEDLDASESEPIYGPPEERKLGREVPLWAIGAAALVVVAMIALFASLLSGGGKAKGTPTPDPTKLARQTMIAMQAATATPVPPTPTPTPTPKPRLMAGGRAVVTGSEPEGLLLRGGPGRDSPARVILKDGTVLEILPKPGDIAQYPVKADGYAWWRVRVISGAEEGLSGWVAGNWLKPLPATDVTPTASP
ncbi:MAG: SH3 domain-containing protein [Anaerolineae bacterium]|nr:SH3 domain-containing protein [Anaerolineae bacterium]